MRPAPLISALLAIAHLAPSARAEPGVDIRAETLFGEPTTLLGVRGGFGLGLGWHLTDQLSLMGDLESRAAPNGGILSGAVGFSAILDITPIEPFLEVAFAQLTNRAALGYSSAIRSGAGLLWPFSRGFAAAVAVRSYAALDPVGNNGGLSGVEASMQLVFTPGAFR